MNQLESMRIFVKVAECLNFGVAAKQLGISNSAVTRGVGALEHHLRLRLINRTTRSVSLTQAGQSYFESCADVLSQVKQIEEKVRAEAESATGRVKIAVSALFAATDLPKLLTEFRKKHPLIAFDVTIYENQAQISPEDFELSFMVERKLRDSSLVCRTLGRTQDVIVAAPCYLESRELLLSPRDLPNYDILLDSESLMRYWTFKDKDGVHRVALVPTMTARNTCAVVRSAVAGLGVARLPRMVIEGELESGKLLPLLENFDLDGKDRTISMLYAGQRYATQAIRSLVDFAIERQAEMSFASRGAHA
ncbi:LysR family transcriptional regulator [Caballeronia ptereochthonis]|uniref:LysR family transcriptional regulator n=1 Tax=Caballeronia ptereochthonis TaxID=1777144 RepID=A0A158AST4_9BURK|nr:LysR family transcriptional regulator [Caballeronia ptereochthonis]SAK60815.1 LysR family transcriptional regulator [Caballeronia ptereochthonis]